MSLIAAATRSTLSSVKYKLAMVDPVIVGLPLGQNGDVISRKTVKT